MVIPSQVTRFGGIWSGLPVPAKLARGCQRLPEVAGGGYAICVDRITACVLVHIIFSGQQALHRLTAGNFVLNALSSGTLWQPWSHGTLWHLLCELCGLWPRVTMGSYGHAKSSYTVWGHLGRFASSGKSCQSSPELAKINYAISVNRIAAQVSVLLLVLISI